MEAFMDNCKEIQSRIESFEPVSYTHLNDRVSANIYYSEDMSHKVYAACDAFLMPSLFEPCGLSQLMSLRSVSYTHLLALIRPSRFSP